MYFPSYLKLAFFTPFNVRFVSFIVKRNQKLTEQILIGTPRKLLHWGTKLGVFDLS